MGTINKLSKEEIIDRLQAAEYYNDEMRQTLEKIKFLFEIDINPDEMEAHNMHYHSDEDFGDVLYGKLCDYKKNKIIEK
tara:strand:+ start:111 stop:347 length:237 start_codon:yes stop_codon:yes gene_type:complete